MKVTKWIELDSVEVSIEITGQDAVDAIMESEGEWKPEQLVRRACSNFLSMMTKVPESAIAAQSDSVRKIIADNLEEQAKRFR